MTRAPRLRERQQTSWRWTDCHCVCTNFSQRMLGIVQDRRRWHLQETGKSVEDYSRSTIVSTSAPTEMGALRKADGQEGFASKATGAAQAAVNKAASLVNGSAK